MPGGGLRGEASPTLGDSAEFCPLVARGRISWAQTCQMCRVSDLRPEFVPLGERRTSPLGPPWQVCGLVGTLVSGCQPHAQPVSHP